MTTLLVILLLAIAGLTGIGLGYFLRFIVSLGKKGSIELEIKELLLKAKEEAHAIIAKAENEAAIIIEQNKEEEKRRELQYQKNEDRLLKKEEQLEKKQEDIEKEANHIKEQAEEIKKIRERVEALEKEKEVELEEVALMSREEAKLILLANIERTHEEDLLVRMQKLERDAQERLDRKAKDILTLAIHRLGNATVADIMTTSVPIPNDELKGKIIGKEGRNIKSFERIAGVELLVDDTPGTITISAFDPVRRHIARVALEMLIADGRIQPAKIEECLEKARNEINKTIKEKGEQAAFECGLVNIDPRLLSLIGRLHFRTSYGQNILQHSVEMAHISGILAEELGADVHVAKAGALLHDIGKAVDHEVSGTHVEIGRRILQKFNIDERIIKAMQAHHEEYPYETLESIIVQVADAISGGRPGARRDSVENYLRRLGELESLANSFEGVDKSFALQAGREIRIFVTPEKITDMQAQILARTIAIRIEQELKYPGEIKVNVIRETRVIEFAR